MKKQNIEIILVDKNDKISWFWEKIDVHKKGLLHRAVSVLIFNKNWELLLQQRALNKYHCWSLRSNTVCTHPKPNENTEKAAHRRMQEEMWFDCEIEKKLEFNYKAKFNNWLIENEYDHVYTWIYNWEIKINKEEVNSYKRINKKDLLQDIKKNKENYTIWFMKIIKKIEPYRNS